VTSVQTLADRWAAPLVALLTRPTTTYREFTLLSTGKLVGSLTVHTGRIADKPVRVVDTRLVIPDLSIDSVMLHAFAPGDSASPHLLSDLASLTEDGEVSWHFHVDLMPRIDLVGSLRHLESVFTPLTNMYDSAFAIAGMRPIQIPPRLRALTSAWLVGAIVSPDDDDAIDAVFNGYVRQWQQCVTEPPETAMDAMALASRDRHHRAAMFNPETDIVWEFLADLIGQDDVDTILEAIKDHD